VGKVPITITVDEETLKAFKKLCEKMDIKVSTKVNSLMKEWALNNYKKQD
jgi:antitoxin component of RelBE/YafQ-DinJ toxin-antitoxin module